MEGKLTAVFERDGQWWIGYVEELPGANTQGKTLEEARENLAEAIQLVVEANREMTRREIKGRSVIREDILLPFRDTSKLPINWRGRSVETWA